MSVVVIGRYLDKFYKDKCTIKKSYAKTMFLKSQQHSTGNYRNKLEIKKHARKQGQNSTRTFRF